MKVLLTAVNSKYIHSNLAVRYLKAYTKDLGYQGEIKEFSINDRVEKILEGIMEEKPDVVAFSCYIWNMEFVNRLAELIKLVNPKIEILYGGPEVSYDSESFLKDHHGEYLICGEGEQTYREFIEYKLGKRELSTIKGLCYKENNEVIFNGVREPMNMNNLVFPYAFEENIENKIVYYEASRGCPFKCKYCLSSVMNGVKSMNIERVKSELEIFMEKQIPLVKFVDRTFNYNHAFTKEILTFLSEKDTNTRFHFEIAADLLRDDEIEILNKAPKGRFQLEVGVQTSNPQVLKNINRYITFENVKEKVLKVAAGGNVIQHLDLIAGLPGEDYESFKNSFNDVHSIKPDEIQLGFLKLLKGSSMREEAEKWGIVYSPYAPYEILSSGEISYEELLKLKKVEEVVDKYYNSGKFKNILKFFLEKFETPFDFYYELSCFFDKNGFFNRSINSTEYYRVLFNFNEEFLNGEEDEILREIIKYDYLSFNKKKWLPDFLIRNMDKNEEREIREVLKKSMEDVKKIHIERFEMDMFSYINDNEKKIKKVYIIFHEENVNNIVDITNLI